MKRLFAAIIGASLVTGGIVYYRDQTAPAKAVAPLTAIRPKPVLKMGDIVAAVPTNCTETFIGKDLYYFDGTYYYTQTDGGYMVVEPTDVPTPDKVVSPQIVYDNKYIKVPFRGVDYFYYNDKWYTYDDKAKTYTEAADPIR